MSDRVFPLPTDTAHVRIESRQYRLMQLDLGEGFPRVALKVGLLFFPPWFLLCAVLDVPLINGMTVWLLPPVAATVFSLMRDPGGRLNLVRAIDLLAWLARGPRRPIVNAGTTSARPLAPIATPIAFLISDVGSPGHDEPRPVPNSVRDEPDPSPSQEESRA